MQEEQPPVYNRCGYQNPGNYCPNCGTRQPEPWSPWGSAPLPWKPAVAVLTLVRVLILVILIILTLANAPPTTPTPPPTANTHSAAHADDATGSGAGRERLPD